MSPVIESIRAASFVVREAVAHGGGCGAHRLGAPPRISGLPRLAWTNVFCCAEWIRAETPPDAGRAVMGGLARDFASRKAVEHEPAPVRIGFGRHPLSDQLQRPGNLSGGQDRTSMAMITSGSGFVIGLTPSTCSLHATARSVDDQSERCNGASAANTL